jgi:GT2 family glycosyltransferase
VTSNVAIVILNYNGRKFLEQFLPSVLASSYPHCQFIVADNASSDDSVNFVKGAFPQVRIIQLEKNFGFARGYNEALKQVSGDYYVLLNSDVQVEPAWIEPIISLMEKDPSVGACQPKLLSFSDKKLFEYAGAAGGWLDCLGYPFARGRIFDWCEPDQGQYDSSVPIFWASGAALFVRASLFQSLGGLDPYFFAHMEEIDFCWRLQRAGFQVYACPQAVVYHVGGGTLPKGNKQKVRLNFRNNLIMLAKNLPVSQAVWKIPFRFILDAISAWKSLFSGEAIYFLAVIEAHAGFFKWLFFHKKSPGLQSDKKRSLQGWFGHSVAWQHFVKGKKTFSEIVQKKG